MKHHGARVGTPNPGTSSEGMSRREGWGRNRPAPSQQVPEAVQQETHIYQLPETQLKIMFQNINGLPASVTNPKNDSLKDTMLSQNINIMGMSETNTARHKVPGHTCMGEHTVEWFKACHISIV